MKLDAHTATDHSHFATRKGYVYYSQPQCNQHNDWLLAYFFCAFQTAANGSSMNALWQKVASPYHCPRCHLDPYYPQRAADRTSDHQPHLDPLVPSCPYQRHLPYHLASAAVRWGCLGRLMERAGR